MKAGGEMSNLEKGRKNGKEANRKILKRTVFLMLFFGIVTFLILVGRLWYLQVIRHDKLEGNGHRAADQ